MDYVNDLKRTPKDSSKWFARLAEARRERRGGRHADEDSSDDSSDESSSSLGESGGGCGCAGGDSTAVEMAAGVGEEVHAGAPPAGHSGDGGGGGGIVSFLALAAVVAGVAFGLGKYSSLRGQQRYEEVTGSLESGG